MVIFGKGCCAQCSVELGLLLCFVFCCATPCVVHVFFKLWSQISHFPFFHVGHKVDVPNFVSHCGKQKVFCLTREPYAPPPSQGPKAIAAPSLRLARLARGGIRKKIWHACPKWT